MMWESQPWKDDLLKTAKRLEARTKQKRWPPRSEANIEKEIFYAFYAIRKLIDRGTRVGSFAYAHEVLRLLSLRKLRMLLNSDPKRPARSLYPPMLALTIQAGEGISYPHGHSMTKQNANEKHP